ncbi:hypothetical protein BZG00_05620 [Salinivibrio kushneri]|uniref:Uncharacterized protein n=1 Tax=Salinivibrio kushneri TaxID=1908198 RepID=A0AB36K0K5_9GAMM|nr:hypothetical protein [Salinivibrio kushneri]OOE40308.1 hypothetical protein BZG00_05620 [Salinivibrio kushneri]QCP01271.1 hypothetical protein FCN78_01970 [Salinivibrio kushneri]
MTEYTDSDRNNFVDKALREGRHADIVKTKFANEAQVVQYLRSLADKIENGACHVDESSVSIEKLTQQYSLEVKLTDTN